MVLDILRTYREPRLVLRRCVGTTAREDRGLATLMAACVTMFVAQLPRLSREAFVDDSIALEARLAGALFGWVLVAPLVCYVLAMISHAALRSAGRDSSGFGARTALFWAFLAAAPLWLISGLVSGFLGQTITASVFGLIAFAGFLVFWATGLAEVGSRRSRGVA